MQQFPEFGSENLAVNQKGNITTVKGKTFAVKNGDSWVIVSTGGRPYKEGEKLTCDLRVRVTSDQYTKLDDYAKSHDMSKPEAIRKIIDEL